MVVEQRKFTRKPLNSTGRIHLPPTSPSGIDVRMVDVSCGGARAACPANPPLKSRCLISFVLPETGEEVVATAVVVRSLNSPNNGGFLVGLEFWDIDTNTIIRIQSFIDNQ